MDLIERLRLAVPMPHQPCFHVEQRDIYWIIYDGDAPIAVVVRDTGAGGATLDVLKFSPRAADRAVALPPYAYHYSTRMGYGATFNWSVGAMFQNPDIDTLELCEESDGRVTFLHAGEYLNGSKLACTLVIGYDAAIGQYSYDLCWDIASTIDTVGEFSNIFHRALMHTDMAVREYNYGCFVRDGVGWLKYPITFLVTGMQRDPLLGVPLAPGGGAGHINRNGVVPMMVNRVSNVPIFMGSCNTCFDLHQTAPVTAGVPAHIESRFADVGPVAAAHPEELHDIPFADLEAYPFHPGEVCDFSHTLHAAQPWSGGFWMPGKGIAITDEDAHCGTRSLKLTAHSVSPVSCYALGPALAMANHTDYEASVWVKLDGEESAQATLELNAFLYSPDNPKGLATAGIVGPHDWTKLTARVNSGIADNGYLILKLTGNAQAWFDEVLVVECEKENEKDNEKEKELVIGAKA